MRILQVSSASTWGGGETHVFQLTEFLREHGHDVLVAGRRDSPLDPQIQLPFLNSADFLTAIRLRRQMNRNGFDIVHAHVARDYTVVAAAAWRIRKTKVVFTRHLLLPVRPSFLYRRADAWIAPTSQIMNALSPVRPKNGVVIPNWVDTKKFVCETRQLHTPVAVGLIGQISPHKGHDDAIEAVRQLGGNFRLLVAGKGESTYETQLKTLSAGLPVDFIGFASLPELFRQIDMLIVPSWEEPFGIVLLEAMAAGIPVIATAFGGPLEIISSPDEGVLIPRRDPCALANAIRSLAVQTERRLAIIRNARQRVERDFDVRTVAPRVENLYRQLVG